MKQSMFLLFVFLSLQTHATPFPWIENAKVHRIWFGQDEFVLELKQSNGKLLVGPCGSSYFHVKNSHGGYREFYSGALAAFDFSKYAKCLGYRLRRQ